MKKLKRRLKKILIAAIVTVLTVAGFELYRNYIAKPAPVSKEAAALLELDYDGEISIPVNDNVPSFTDEEKERAEDEVFEEYSDLDSLGRCGAACANLCYDLMPTGKRESLSSVTPSGWQKINFWTRAHLIGYQLAGEQANEKNLITGTSRMNATGMLEYENEVADYIRNGYGRHVLYRVTPLFEGKNLVANGVQMEAWSVEDEGKSISFNVYVFNYQPGYIVDYSDGSVEEDPAHTTSIHLSDTVAKYTGEPIWCNDAEVEGSTGHIRYIYYRDKQAKTKTDERDGSYYSGSAPSKRGTYRVRAVVSGDDWYPNAASNVAKLVID